MNYILRKRKLFDALYAVIAAAIHRNDGIADAGSIPKTGIELTFWQEVWQSESVGS